MNPDFPSKGDDRANLPPRPPLPPEDLKSPAKPNRELQAFLSTAAARFRDSAKSFPDSAEIVEKILRVGFEPLPPDAVEKYRELSTYDRVCLGTFLKTYEKILDSLEKSMDPREDPQKISPSIALLRTNLQALQNGVAEDLDQALSGALAGSDRKNQKYAAFCISQHGTINESHVENLLKLLVEPGAPFDTIVIALGSESLGALLAEKRFNILAGILLQFYDTRPPHQELATRCIDGIDRILRFSTPLRALASTSWDFAKAFAKVHQDSRQNPRRCALFTKMRGISDGFQKDTSDFFALQKAILADPYEYTPRGMIPDRADEVGLDDYAVVARGVLNSHYTTTMREHFVIAKALQGLPLRYVADGFNTTDKYPDRVPKVLLHHGPKAEISRELSIPIEHKSSTPSDFEHFITAWPIDVLAPDDSYGRSRSNYEQFYNCKAFSAVTYLDLKLARTLNAFRPLPEAHHLKNVTKISARVSGADEGEFSEALTNAPFAPKLKTIHICSSCTPTTLQSLARAPQLKGVTNFQLDSRTTAEHLDGLLDTHSKWRLTDLNICRVEFNQQALDRLTFSPVLSQTLSNLTLKDCTRSVSTNQLTSAGWYGNFSGLTLDNCHPEVSRPLLQAPQLKVVHITSRFSRRDSENLWDPLQVEDLKSIKSSLDELFITRMELGGRLSGVLDLPALENATRLGFDDCRLMDSDLEVLKAHPHLDKLVELRLLKQGRMSFEAITRLLNEGAFQGVVQFLLPAEFDPEGDPREYPTIETLADRLREAGLDVVISPIDTANKMNTRHLWVDYSSREAVPQNEPVAPADLTPAGGIPSTSHPSEVVARPGWGGRFLKWVRSLRS